MSEKLFSPGDQPLDLVSQCDKLNKKSDLKKKKMELSYPRKHFLCININLKAIEIKPSL